MMPPRLQKVFVSIALFVMGAVSLCLTGCSMGSLQSAPTASAGVKLSGFVHGGQQPITGALVFMYAAGTGGYNTSARSMLTSPGYVTTGAGGAFSITGDYTCQAGDQVYLYATGGNPGLTNGTNNASIGLLAALGPCSSLTGGTNIIINETTTIAAAYALSGFMNTPTTLSSSGTSLALSGVTNAFATAQSLVNSFTGATRTTTAGGNGTVPSAEINTLGNILAGCVNTDGTGTPCSTLMTSATPPLGTAPTNTAQAAINIAHNPGLNITPLFSLVSASAPFQSALSAAPHDWSIAITYTGGGLYTYPGTGIQYSGTYAEEIDGLGNIWVAALRDVAEFSPTGTPLSPSTGYTAGVTTTDFTNMLAIDSSNNAWVGVFPTTSQGLDVARIIKINGAGTLLSPAGGYTGGGLATFGASGLAFDSPGNLWLAGGSANSSGGAMKFSSSGAAISPTAGYPATGAPSGALAFSPSVLGDTAGHIWAAGVEFASTGSTLTVSSPCGSTESETGAIDRNGNLWGTGGYNSATNTQGLLECNSAGALTTSTAGYPISTSAAEGVAVDGDNRIWYFDYGYAGHIGAMTASGTPISPAGGYQMEQDTGSSADYMAIDGSGNIWVADDSAYVVEFVGIASPVVTPLATGVANNKLGTRP